MSSTTSNFYKHSAQCVPTMGDRAHPINNLAGEKTMDNEYTQEELQAIEELNNANAHAGKDKTSARIPDEIPAGSYLASITKANATIHDVGKYDIISMEIRVQAEPYTGFVLNKVYHQKTKKSVEFFKREMKEIGSQIHGRDELDVLCESLVGKIIIVELMDQESGNQAAYLKSANTKKNVAPIDPEKLW